MSGTVFINNDHKDKFGEIQVYSKEFSLVHPGYGQYEDQAILNFKEKINNYIDSLITYRDSLDYKLTKVYVDYTGDPI